VSGDIGLWNKNPRSSIGLEIRPQSAFTAFRALMPCANYSQINLINFSIGPARNNIKNNNRDPSAALIGSLTDYKNKQINKYEIKARGNIRKKI